MEIKRSIFIETKEWQDSNGFTYFASWIHADGKLVAVAPFQYGYGSQHEWEAKSLLSGLGADLTEFTPYSLNKVGIDLYTSKTPALYRDLKAWAKAGQAIIESREIFAGISAAQTLEA